MLLRAALAVLVAASLAGCAHESDSAQHVRPESADEFARRALGVMDAATTCPQIEAAWDAYVEPVTRSAIREFVPCTRDVLAAAHPVGTVTEYGHRRYFELPAALRGAEVHGIRLAVPDLTPVDSFPIAAFLDDGWFVVTEGHHQWLLNPGISSLAECLRTNDECRVAG